MAQLRTPTWVILLICWIALLCDGYDLYVYGATLPGFLGNPEWGVTKSLAGTVGSIALIGMLLAVWRWMPESEVFLAAKAASVTAGRARASGVSRLFTAHQLLPTLLFWIVCAISMLGITTWLPVIMQGAGFAAESSIAFLSIYSLGCIIGTVVIAWIAQQSAPKYMVILGFSIAALSLLAVSMTQNHLLLFAAIFFAGVGGMGTQNMINDHIAQYYPPEVRATGLGWALAAGRLGAIAGPTYGAVAATVGGSPGAAAMWFAIPAVLGAGAAIAMPLRDKAASMPPAKNTSAEGVAS